jgi:hypothetical protein
LSNTHGGATQAMLLDRIRKQVDDRGTRDVILLGPARLYEALRERSD